MILLDVNGTLMDFKSIKGKIFNEMTLPYFRKWGFKGTPGELKRVIAEVDEYLKYRIHTLKDYPREVAGRLDLEVSEDEIHQENSDFKQMMIEGVQLLPGTKEALKKLSALDSLAIFTNGWDQIVFPALKKFEILNYFSDVVCIGGTGLHKEGGHVFPELKRRGAWAMIGDKPEVDGLCEKSGIAFVDVRQGWSKTVEEIIDLKRRMPK